MQRGNCHSKKFKSSPAGSSSFDVFSSSFEVYASSCEFMLGLGAPLIWGESGSPQLVCAKCNFERDNQARQPKPAGRTGPLLLLTAEDNHGNALSMLKCKAFYYAWQPT